MRDARAAILRAGRAHFLEYGFADASLGDIQRAAEVSNGSLYHHFPSKAHLAAALYLDALSSYQAALMAAIEEQPRGREGVERMLDAHASWVFAHPADARVLAELADATTVDGQPVEWSLVNRDAFAAISMWIQRCVDRGEMQAMPLPLWLALVFGPTMLLTSGWAQMKVREVEPMLRRALAAAAWAGVKRQAPEAGSRESSRSKPTKKRA